MARLDDPQWSEYRKHRSIDESMFQERFGWRPDDYRNHVYGDTTQDLILDLAQVVITLELQVLKLEAHVQMLQKWVDR